MKIAFHFESRDGLKANEEFELEALSQIPDQFERPLRPSVAKLSNAESGFDRRLYLLDDITEINDVVSAFYKEI